MRYAKLIIIFLMWGYCEASGQTLIDQVRVKSGEKYQGLIIEQKPSQYIKIALLLNADTVKVNYEDLDLIQKVYLIHDQTFNQPSIEPVITTVFNNKDLFSIIELGMGGGVRNIRHIAQPVKGILGFRVFNRRNENLALGVGIKTVVSIVGNLDLMTYLPITAEGRWEFSGRSMKKSSYVNAGIGFSPNLNFSHVLSLAASFNSQWVEE